MSKDLADKISEIQCDISYTYACSSNKETYAVTFTKVSQEWGIKQHSRHEL